MDTVWTELIKALPWGFVLLVMRYLEIKDQKDQRAERVNNATEKAKVERDFEMEKNKLWAETIKTVLDRQTDSAREITATLKEMHKDLQDKYESMGNTKDLLDAARRELAGRTKSNEPKN